MFFSLFYIFCVFLQNWSPSGVRNNYPIYFSSFILLHFHLRSCKEEREGEQEKWALCTAATVASHISWLKQEGRRRRNNNAGTNLITTPHRQAGYTSDWYILKMHFFFRKICSKWETSAFYKPQFNPALDIWCPRADPKFVSNTVSEFSASIIETWGEI